MENTLEILMSQLEEERNRLHENLGEGGPKDFAEYKFTVGVVRGLHIAQSLISDLAKHMEQDDE
jgi:hypothetical protein